MVKAGLLRLTPRNDKNPLYNGEILSPSPLEGEGVMYCHPSLLTLIVSQKKSDCFG